MSVNVDAMLHLAKSILSCILLSLCSYGSQVAAKNSEGSVTDAVQWASLVVLLSAVYYLQFQFWRRVWFRKRERRSRSQYSASYRQTRNSASLDQSSRGSVTSMEDVDLDRMDSGPMDSGPMDSLPPIGEEWSEGTSISNTVYYPELTMSSVWTYVYGWGVLLFVCIYCLAGVDVPSSCWWVMGMIALSFDELISKGAGKWFVCLVGLSLSGSVFAVWSGTLMDENGNFIGDLLFTKKGNLPLLNFVLGVVFPVSTPFIFFSIRSTVRSVTKDVYRLCEFALPFMTVLAVCCLVATSGVWEKCEMCEKCENCGSQRRDLLESNLGKTKLESMNATMIETVAKFAGSYNNNLNGHHARISLDSNTIKYSLLLLSPIAAFWLLRVLIIDILTGHATEFITAFLLVTSARYGMTHAMGFWPVMALSGAGSAFILLLLNLRGGSWF